jgi:hypothetical protein
LSGLASFNLVIFDRFFEILVLWNAMFYNVPEPKNSLFDIFSKLIALECYVFLCSRAKSCTVAIIFANMNGPNAQKKHQNRPRSA